MDMDYEKALRDTITRYGEINRQVEELEIEQSKLLQFAYATLNFLPDGRKKEFAEAIQSVISNFRTRNEGLTDAIRRVLQSEAGNWLTVATVRDYLVARGFDFSQYVSNPLASISTTMKRIEEKEPLVEADMIEGVAVYRWTGVVDSHTVSAPPKRTPSLKDLIVKEKVRVK